MKTAVVLAAGESRRLGRPKQLLLLEQQTLVQRAVRHARLSGVDDVVVVTGAVDQAVRESIQDEACHVLHNGDWREGIGSSIRCAARHLQAQDSRPEFVLLLLCDQPFVDPEHLRALVKSAALPPAEIAATLYPDGAKGIPACFPAACLDHLAELSGSVGARQLILSRPSRVIPHASVIDIDTEDDVRDYLSPD